MEGCVDEVFASDNTAGICPQAARALEEANRGAVASYGEDKWTARLCHRVREIFERDCDVFLVFNGTAANALALSQLCHSYESVICHENAHIQNDECGAVERFTGGAKLIPTRGENGKLDLDEVEATLERQPELHSHRPGALSITQASELGRVYTIDEVQKISECAEKRGLALHMDGARFANAVARLSCAPKEISWQAGVDVLCLGGTKNGLAGGELVVFFNRAESNGFDYRLKQAGQLASKMRFLAAPWLALLENDLWLENARRANAGAQKLADNLRRAGADIVFPVEANAVFLRVHEVCTLRERGWVFFKFLEPDVYRLMCPWSVKDEWIEKFTADFAESCTRAAA